MAEKVQLSGLPFADLQVFVKEQGLPAFRARQLQDWLVKGREFSGMGNLPASLLSKLAEVSLAQAATINERHVSKIDGTQKLLFGLLDGHTVEGVLMQYQHGKTLCLSTQVGCRMGCAFCASTLGGLLRNLSAGEMASMAYLANSLAQPEGISNIVLMGSGEPMDNYEQVVAFLRLISHQDSLNIGLRHISLSTCGLPDKIRQLAQEGLPLTLSISLHAPNDDIRQQIMPIARAHPVRELLAACRYYLQQTGRRLVFEYALISGINDQDQHARELAALMRGMQAHVNLIPLNAVPERGLQAPSKARVQGFLKTLLGLHISATVRRQLGDDIFGACGQLRAQRLKTPLVAEQAGGDLS